MRTERPILKEMNKVSLNVLGMAVDEMILATAMVGSVGLFAVVSVPWETVMRTDQTRLLDELTAIEEANASFYRQQHRWPFEMTDGSSEHNAAALVTEMALRHPYNLSKTYRPVLENVPFDLQGNRVSLRHGFGAGGRIIQEPSDNPAYTMKVTFENMPLNRVKEMDVAMDKKANLDAGRVQVEVDNNQIDMVFYANPKRMARR